MRPSRVPQRWAWISAALLATGTVAVGWWGVGQDPASAEQPSAQKPAAETPAQAPVPEKAASEVKEKFRPRLPNYYNRVVDEAQRQKIYDIQREYFPKIEALEAQLAALIAERDEKVEAVLTPEQHKEVEKLRAEAKQKRAKGAKEKSAA